MRGDHADLGKIMQIAAKYDAQFAENVIVVADDSHGVGGFGATGAAPRRWSAAPRSTC